MDELMQEIEEDCNEGEFEANEVSKQRPVRRKYDEEYDDLDDAED